MSVILDGKSLTLESVAEVVGGTKVELDTASLRRMRKFRLLLEKKLARGDVVYGVNTGFGSLADKAVSLGKIKELQLNLVRSHAAGVGGHMPLDVVKTAMVIRMNSLLNGNSAVRPDVVHQMASMLNRGVIPHVPKFGSLGASGDLIPSAHMALAMIGEGSAEYGGKCLESASALSRAKLSPIELKSKEGLSLINGTCFTAGLACTVVNAGIHLLAVGNSCVALTAEAVAACSQSFDPRLVRMKKDPGQVYVAREIRQMLKGSRRMRASPVPQDPYSIRCTPQVHGALKDALDFAENLTVAEINSVSDNPVLLENGTVLHGGNFHAQPVAMALDLLTIALAYLGVISLSRIGVLLSKPPAGKKFMAGNPGLESGLMILQYTATALTAENAKETYPLSTYPANVSGGIEDHASHGVSAGLKALKVAQNVSEIFAIEMICASNLLGLGSAGLSNHSRIMCTKIRRASPLLKGDRSLGDEIETLASSLASEKAA